MNGNPSPYAKKTTFGDHTLYNVGSGLFKIDGRVPCYKEEAFAFVAPKLSESRVKDLRLWLGMDSI